MPTKNTQSPNNLIASEMLDCYGHCGHLKVTCNHIFPHVMFV